MEKKNSRQRHTIGLTVLLKCLSSRHKVLCLKMENIPKNKTSKKKMVEQNFKNRKSWKKRTRGNCEAEASPPKKSLNSEDPSGSIRDITAHLIHDKNTSITVSCTVFNFPSAGNDPGWIHWSYEFLFF